MNLPKIPDVNWETARPIVRRNFQKIDSLLYGPEANVTFGSLTTDTLTTDDLNISSLTASRLVASDADKDIVSVDDLTAWIAGTENQVVVTDDEDGTVTLSTPQNIHTSATPQFAGLGIGEANDGSSYIGLFEATSKPIKVHSDGALSAGEYVGYEIQDEGIYTWGIGIDYDEGAGSLVFQSGGLHGTTLYKMSGSDFINKGSNPSWNIINAVDENGQDECGSIFNFKDHTETILTQIIGAHDGTSDDTKGVIVLSTHNGADLIEALRIDSSQDAAFAGDVTGNNLSGTNTGDQTSIVGISGTKAQFNTACSDGDFIFVGDAPTAHIHDGDTLQLDGVNSDGGAFSFTTTGLVTFNQSIKAANFEATNKLTACATNAGVLDFSAASKTLTVEDDAIVSQDYSSDADVTFNDLTLSTPSNIYSLSHNLFASYDADEHVAHSGVAITAGTGLSGGGTIDGNITIDCDITQYTDELAQDAIGGMIADTNTVNLTYTDETPELKADVLYQNSTTIDLSDDASGLKADLDSTLKTNYDAAYSHVSNDGTDHSYIDQSVVVIGTPQFAGLGVGIASDSPTALIHTSHAGNTAHLIMDNSNAGADGNAIQIMSKFKDSGGTYRDGAFIYFPQTGVYATSIDCGCEIRPSTSTRRFYLKSNGYVGICKYNKDPETWLHVQRNELTGGYTPNPSYYQLAVENDAHSGMAFIAGTTGNNQIAFCDTVGERGLIQYAHSTDNLSVRAAISMDFKTAGSDAITIDSSQNVTFGGSIFQLEKSAANADVEGYGQLWVKDDTPNTLYFTDDAGNDKKLMSLIDRGDPSAWDYQIGSLTTDAAWHDLDLSSIVPAGATFVLLKIGINDDAQSTVFFRENGNSNEYNVTSRKLLVVNTYQNEDITVACDSNRVIEYKANNTTWTAIDILVRGWYV